MHAVSAVSFAKKPLSQSGQEAWPLEPSARPAVQVVHPLRPATSVYRPAEHTVHEVADNSQHTQKSGSYQQPRR